MTFRCRMRAPLALAILGITLAGCGGGETGSDIALQNPDFFVARTVDGVISGNYNPAGYSDAKVKSLLATLCAQTQLATYGEQVTESGLAAFSATCRGETRYGRVTTEFERMEAESIVIENTYFDASGNARTERLEMS